MTKQVSKDLKYPIGKFRKPDSYSEELIESWISDIEIFPETLRQEVESLTDKELNWIYRPGGWTIKQVVHHCADSHINSITRFKLALTEDKPIIKPYLEAQWANLPDTTQADVSTSLELLSGLHKRWVILLRNMKEKDYRKKFVHPESGNEMSLGGNLALYSWHCRHHLAHISQAKKFKGVFI